MCYQCGVFPHMVTLTHLGHHFEHRDQDKLDEPNLGRGFGHFVPVHERGHRKALGLLAVALGDAVGHMLERNIHEIWGLCGSEGSGPIPVPHPTRPLCRRGSGSDRDGGGVSVATGAFRGRAGRVMRTGCRDRCGRCSVSPGCSTAEVASRTPSLLGSTSLACRHLPMWAGWVLCLRASPGLDVPAGPPLGAPPASAAYLSGHSPASSTPLAAQLLVTGGGFQCSLSRAVPVFPVAHCTHPSWVCTCCEGFLEAGEIVCDPLH